MRRLTRSFSLCAVALVLAAPAAGGQTADAPAQPSTSIEAATPLPAILVPEAASAEAVGAMDEAGVETISHVRMEEAEMRGSVWTYPAIGLVAGALAGAAYGTWVMREADDWVAPPAHFFTIPAGAVLGLALGGLANVVHPR